MRTYSITGQASEKYNVIKGLIFIKSLVQRIKNHSAFEALLNIL